LGEKRANQGKKRKILVFGNPMLKNDSLPIRLIPRLVKNLPQIEFKEFDPNENLEKEGRDLVIIDSVEGIDKVVLIKDIDRITTPKVYSMHDFDLGYSLKLLKKLDLIDSVMVFGVPMRISEREALKQLKEKISGANLS
jgi:Ni,Fe-hydrogenase maturation factor